jgi:hypothetical protein
MTRFPGQIQTVWVTTKPHAGGYVLTQDMNADLTAAINLTPFYRHTLVLFGHYTSRANDWQPCKSSPRMRLNNTYYFT